jgi:hypothetical protein
MRSFYAVLVTAFLVSGEWGVGVPPDMFKVFDNLL